MLLLEHALGPYARGERNAFGAPLRLTATGTSNENETAVDVDSFSALLDLYHGKFSARHGADPGGWGSDGEAQELVQELTANFLRAAESDFRLPTSQEEDDRRDK